MKVIGVDFGATYLRFGIVENGVVLKKVVFATPKTAGGVIDAFRKAFKILHSSGISKKSPVGIATIGPLSAGGEIVKGSPNVKGLKINFRKIVEKFHDGELVVLNDCTAAVLAEGTIGRWRRYDNIVYISISTGIGGGVVVNGHLLEGKDGNAAEIGHIVVDYKSNVRCGCGGLGHWEALCSGMGLPKLALSLLGQKIWKTAPEIFHAAYRKDKRAMMVLEKMALLNAAAFASVINAFDPEIVVVGGGVALNHPKETVINAEKLLKKYALLRARIEMSSLGADGPLLGACIAAAKKYEHQ